MTTCAQPHEYSERTCVLEAHSDDTPHQAADGLKWFHHEVFIAHDEYGGEVWDIWDQPPE